MPGKLKKHHTIGCCGIDCGLCPRFHTNGNSACPGCGGVNFKEKHPSCGFVTCCAIKRGLEVCSDCNEYPCSRFDPEKEGFDSFVTHKKVFANLGFIKANGMDCFISQQTKRMEVLTDFIANYDDGRSKSFFCVSCALLPLDQLQAAQRFIANTQKTEETKAKNKKLKELLNTIAEDSKTDLKLNTKRN